MKLGDRAIFGGTAVLVLGGFFFLASERRRMVRQIREEAIRDRSQWDGGIRWLKPRPGVRRRIV